MGTLLDSRRTCHDRIRLVSAHHSATGGGRDLVSFPGACGEPRGSHDPLLQHRIALIAEAAPTQPEESSHSVGGIGPARGGGFSIMFESRRRRLCKTNYSEMA